MPQIFTTHFTMELEMFLTTISWALNRFDSKLAHLLACGVIAFRGILLVSQRISIQGKVFHLAFVLSSLFGSASTSSPTMHTQFFSFYIGLD